MKNNIKSFVISLLLFAQTVICMEQPNNYLAMDNVNQKSILQQIIKHIGAQDDCATKVENLRALLKCRRVNKIWQNLIDTEYKFLLKIEEAIVTANAYDDYNAMHVAKGIRGAGVWAYACALQRNLIVCLHTLCSKNKTSITGQLYFEEIAGEVIEYIYPITWAIYMNAPASKTLLEALCTDKVLLKQQGEKAEATKKSFDDFKPNDFEHLGRNNWGRITRNGNVLE